MSIEATQTASSEPDLVRGAQLQKLLTDPSWVSRRVETVKFTADGLVRRSVSVDFAVPEDLRLEVSGKHTALVPVALLRKQALAILDTTDESGSTIPVLGTNDNGLLAYSTLCAKALGLLGETDAAKLPSEVRRLLYEIALEPPDVATACLSQLRKSNDRTLTQIGADPIFYKLAQDLATNFILLVEIADGPEQPARRIVKIAYMTTPQVPRWRSAWDVLWRPNERRFGFEIPSMGESRSYHFQLAPPHGVVVVGCRGTVRPPYGSADVQELGRVIGGAAHLHARRPVAGTVATAEVRLSPRSHGAVLSSLVASLLIVGVIGSLLAWHLLGPAAAVNEDWQALLVVFPGVVAGFLASHDELGLSSRLLANARRVLLVSALVTFTLAGALVFGVTASWWERLLWAGLAVSGLCFARLLQWYWRCQGAAAFTQG